MRRERRTILSWIAAGLLVVTLLPAFSPARLRARLEPLESVAPDAAPAYAAFLDATARATPPTATVAVSVPKEPGTYFYRAVYRLAPRRVVSMDRAGHAAFVAVYSTARDATPAGAQPLPGGYLKKR